MTSLWVWSIDREWSELGQKFSESSLCNWSGQRAITRMRLTKFLPQFTPVSQLTLFYVSSLNRKINLCLTACANKFQCCFQISGIKLRAQNFSEVTKNPIYHFIMRQFSN